jgi:hypothetical protein
MLLTLVDESNTGIANAYADDLVHLAPSLEDQQRQSDLMCGFCAITGLELSLSPKLKPYPSTMRRFSTTFPQTT